MDTDKLRGIRDVLQAKRPACHSRGELELDDLAQREELHAVLLFELDARGVGKRDGLGLSVTGIASRGDDVDAHPGLGIADVLRARKERPVSEADELLVDPLPVFSRDDVSALAQFIIQHTKLTVS